MNWHCLESSNDSTQGNTRLNESLGDNDAEEHEHMVCAACGHGITHLNARVSSAGSHEHTFANPHGFCFTIGCFGEAIGCETEGVPSDEYSWFAGYSWQIAVCRRCNTHLGWFFQTTTQSAFFGLILNRLVQRQ